MNLHFLACLSSIITRIAILRNNNKNYLLKAEVVSNEINSPEAFLYSESFCAAFSSWSESAFFALLYSAALELYSASASSRTPFLPWFPSIIMTEAERTTSPQREKALSWSKASICWTTHGRNPPRACSSLERIKNNKISKKFP